MDSVIGILVFQSLIGELKTFTGQEKAKVVLEFQSLIGELKTKCYLSGL